MSARTMLRRMNGSLRGAVRAVLPRRVSDAVFRAFLRRRAVRRSIEDFEAREIEREFCGHRLRICVEDPVAEWWYGDGWPLLPEIAELQRGALRPGALVFDAGMHQGVLAMVFARIVGPQGRVVGVEPEPHNVRVARRNLALNRVDNVEIVQAAASDRPGTLFFEENIGGRVVGTARGSIEVQAVTIDELAARHGEPDVVFVDVEGAEGSVVAGAAKTLAHGRATWFVEVHQGLGLEPPGWPDPVEVVSAFPRDRFEVLIAVEGATYRDEHVFEPLGSSLPEGRFFMIATPIGLRGRPAAVRGGRDERDAGAQDIAPRARLVRPRAREQRAPWQADRDRQEPDERARAARQLRVGVVQHPVVQGADPVDLGPAPERAAAEVAEGGARDVQYSPWRCSRASRSESSNQNQKRSSNPPRARRPRGARGSPRPRAAAPRAS